MKTFFFISVSLNSIPSLSLLPVLHALLYCGLPCDLRLRSRPGDEDHLGRERRGALQVLLPGAQQHQYKHQQHLQLKRNEQRQSRHRFHRQRSTRWSQTRVGRPRSHLRALAGPAKRDKWQQRSGAEVGIAPGFSVGVGAG